MTATSSVSAAPVPCNAGATPLRVRDLSVGFATAGRVLTAVDQVSFDLVPGETLALLGESGCGKSATALALLRLLPEAGRILGGRVELNGDELLSLPQERLREVRGNRLAMIFQEPATSLNPVLTVGQQIGEVLARHRDLTGEPARARAEALLRQVGISDPAGRLAVYPFQLSGGMKQRVMIAIALAAEPRFLLADEPTTALDVTIQAQILDLLRELQAKQGMGMLLITHDLGVVAEVAHRVGVMYAGQLIEIGRRDDFFRRPAHPYTRALFAALPDVAQRGQRLLALPGQVPTLARMPAGCRFAPRCPRAFARCSAEAPAWWPVDAESAPDDGAAQRVRCHLFDPAEAADPLGRGRAIAPSAAPSPAAVVPVSPAPEAPLLVVDDLRVHFPIRRGLFKRTVGWVKAVDGVSLHLARGRTLALVGESGCGKTTVGKGILRLLMPTGGSVQLAGRTVPERGRQALADFRRQMQMVFQDPFASLNPHLTVGAILLEGMTALGVVVRGASAAQRNQAVAALLDQVGLPAEAAHRYPHEFSGGQRQRIAIARALAVQPDLLICDEPTSALDVSVQAQILNLLADLQGRLGLAYLFITHNFAVVEYLAHEVAVMYLGRIVERGTVEEVLRDPQHPYTRALLAAVPRVAGNTVEEGGATSAPALALSGETPSPASPPQGCHFQPRCPLADAACRVRYPDETHLSPTRVVRCHRLAKP
ncbi:ATPase component ABC-type dipeptide/oligopeptide/nickel transport system [Oryzomicrobium terrae]|uniref:ATPase component ABC-type dipeptide/oligopeptide/nickel transport system n=1 Tax=Oryzomicrobium terrae TaxID=1735038 RepID=A0A5C1E7T3_9RHOO|nr:ABC transporter ATP-binding protein [Oryzomicrobium terrae]QEL64675.1 ATPase component ABC-type dipeptide/oligopeptide/nickel transport system [Oryzomicrobium terrae]